MKKTISLILSILLCIGMFPATGFAATQIPAFPGAEGAAMYVTGGRGGNVYTVTSLDDYNTAAGDAVIPGTLRYALTTQASNATSGTTARPPLTVVFAVSGTIHLKVKLKVNLYNVTIAGQTAPGDGIAIGDYLTSFGGSNNIIRYVRFRGGFAELSDCFDITGSNMIIDHSSFSWSTDECLSMKEVKNITVQWCIISDPLNISIHDKGAHGYGAIWGGTELSFHHNLLVNNSSRNPRFDRDYTVDKNEPLIIDFRNNVVANWGINTSYGGEYATGINMINNYYKAGLSSFDSSKGRIVNPSSDNPGSYYIDGNIVEGYPEINADNWNGGVQPDFGLASVKRLSAPYATAGQTTTKVTTDSATDAYYNVLNSAGAILPKRDDLDARITNDVKFGTGRIVNSPASEGGYPVLNSTPAPADSDNDGIPDAWETTHGLNANSASDGKLIGSDGYSNLEKYLNSITTNGSNNPTVAITSPTLNQLVSSGTNMTIQASASDSDGTIAKVEFYSSDSKLGEATSAPYTYTWNNVPAGTYYLYAKAIDNTGTSTLSTQVTVHVNDSEIGAPWTSQDIGSVAIPGSGSYSQTNDAMTVKGSGQVNAANADGTTYSDSFHYVYQPVTGDGQIQANTVEASDVDNAATAGVMVRSDLSTDAPFAMMTISKEENYGTCANFVVRTAKGGLATIAAQQQTITTPIYLQVVRQGNKFSGYTSPNGSNWTLVGSATINMPENAYMGLAVDANKATSNTDYLNTVKFTSTQLIKAPGITLSNPDNSSVNVPEYTVSGQVSNVDGWPAAINSGASGNQAGQTTGTGTTTGVQTSTANNLMTMTTGLNDTVVNSVYTIQGTLNKNTAVSITLNDTKVMDAQSFTAGQNFSQQLTFLPGRNSVVITATDSSGNTDTIAYNVVYLTNYSAMVDSTSTLADGTLVNNIKVYKTVQAAINEVSTKNASSYIIFIKNGIYNEKVNIISGANYISLIGESKAGTKITHNLDLATYTRAGSATLYVKSDNFTAENITFENSAFFNVLPLPSDMRALAAEVDSNSATFQNVAFLGRQDTLYVDTSGSGTGRQYFKNCFISGDVDFIYGPSVAVFDNCELNSLDRGQNPNGYVTAANTPTNRQYGFVFLNCKLTSSTAAAGTVYLGRPWGQDATVVFLNSYMGDHINSDGWTEMEGKTPSLAHFSEYKSYGPGAAVNSARPQLTDTQAATYTVSNILSVGDGWDPIGYINNLYNQSANPQTSGYTSNNDAYVTVSLNGTTVLDSEHHTYDAAGNTFSVPMALVEGLNTIIVSASNGLNLTTTKTITVQYNKNAPVITLTAAPGQVVSAPNSSIAGYSNKDVKMTVKLNGNTLLDSLSKAANESFSQDVVFNEGANTLQVIATDADGVSTDLTYNVVYSKDWGTNEFTVTSLLTQNIDGNPVTGLNGLQDIFVSGQFKNNSSISKDGLLVIALYDAQGNMVGSSYSVDNVDSGSVETISAIFKIPSGYTGYTVKAFVWDNAKVRTLLSNEAIMQ